MPVLNDTQRLLWSLITAPEGVAKALADPAGGAALAAALDRSVHGTPDFSAAEHLDVYANMYFFRLLDVLKADYPAVLAVIGDTGFHNLVTDYLLVHFPSHPSLRFAGAHVAEFLSTHNQTAAHPFLPDLARVEWALVEAFDAKDARVLEATELAALPPESWADLTFRAHPSVRVIDCGWAVQLVRDRVDRGEPVGAAEPGATGVCVWRRGFEVFHRALGPVEQCALGVLLAGQSFAAACTAVAEIVGDGAAAQAVAGSLATWLREGLLSECEAG